jgi:hypothetical protein
MTTIGDQIYDLLIDQVKDVVSLADDREGELLEQVAELEIEVEKLNSVVDELQEAQND